MLGRSTRRSFLVQWWWALASLLAHLWGGKAAGGPPELSRPRRAVGGSSLWNVAARPYRPIGSSITYVYDALGQLREIRPGPPIEEATPAMACAGQVQVTCEPPHNLHQDVERQRPRNRVSEGFGGSIVIGHWSEP